MKVKLDPFWCIVRPSGVMLKLTAKHVKKDTIANFVDSSDRIKKLTWKDYQKEGYRCYKFGPVLLSK